MIRSGNECPFIRVRAVAIACCLLLGAGAAQAQSHTWRRVTITNVTISPRDSRTAAITFNIAWERSWRNEVNHDAAWVFLKYRPEGVTNWRHVRLTADRVLNPAGYGHGKGVPMDLLVPKGKDGFAGMFVRRAEMAKPADVETHGVTAVWDLTASEGVKDLGKAQIRAFGVPMVYVAKGPFYLGSGGAEVNGFYMYTDGTQHTRPYRVTGPGAIPTGRQAGRLWARSSKPFVKSDSQPENGGEISAAFPNGYAAFYCMKGPITFAQYAGFLNTLPPAEAEKRFSEHAATRAGKAPNFTYRPRTIGKSGPRGFSWADGAAWAAWAGLRPLTELEYEKSIRGPRRPLPDETGPSYWGVRGQHGWDWFSYHPARLCERPVTVANAVGRRFRGTHGLGTTVLPKDWPQADAVGTGYRAGSSGTKRGLQCTRISDRTFTAFANPKRGSEDKWRGVRTAPKEAGQ